MSAVLYRCVLSTATSATNVADNHRLFSGQYPPPEAFGFTDYTPGTEVPEGAADVKVWPNLANAEGTGPHVDYLWIHHGVPSYLDGKLNLSHSDLMHNNYRIVENIGPESDSDTVQGKYKVIRTGPPTAVLEKRTQCRGEEMPVAAAGAATAQCHNNHAATLEDCGHLWQTMDSPFCRWFGPDERVWSIYRSCAIVARRGRSARTCITAKEAAAYALPIIDQCWPRNVPHECTNWRSGVIQSSNTAPKSCVCNRQSYGAC